MELGPNLNSDKVMENKSNLNLLEFSRLYKIYEIPIINFVIIYIILYGLNCLHFDCNFKNVLILTIPITLIFSAISNPKLKLSPVMVIVLIASVVVAILSFSTDDN